MVNTAELPGQSTKKEQIEFLHYVLEILNGSRSKKRAQARLEGFIRKRIEENSDCVTYNKEMINDYLTRNPETKKKSPKPPYEG